MTSEVAKLLMGIVIMVLVVVMEVTHFQDIRHWINTTFYRLSILVPSVAIENPDGSITITVTADIGNVTIQGLAVYSPSGAIATIGTTPVNASLQSCSLLAIYANGRTYTSLPVAIQTGQSATIILSPGCQNAISVTIFYNNGKSIDIQIG
jgi:hypothetical protein